MSLNLCIKEEIDIKSETNDTEFDSNETFGQNTTLIVNEMDTDNIEIGVEDVKPFEFVEVNNESLLAKPDLKKQKFNFRDKDFQCSICSATFTRLTNLNFHLHTHTETKPYSCHVCGIKFTLARHVTTHLLHVHQLDANLSPASTSSNGEKITQHTSHICKICFLTFKKTASLKRHMKCMHQEIKPFECSLCGAGFINKSKLDTHLLIHTGEKPNKCSICSQVFRLKSSIRRHLFFKHGNVVSNNVIPNKQPTLPIFISQENDTVCVQVGSSESLSQDFQDNVKIEPHDTEFDSNKTFGQNTTLSVNEMDKDNIEIGVEDVKPFEIVKVKMEASVTDNSLTCGKSNEEFSSRELTSHESVFKCKICNKTFTKQSSLSCHLRIHEESKSFTCPECSSKFSRRGYLKKHLLLTHKLDENEAEGLLPRPESHICEICNFLFKRQIHLKKHIEAVHTGLMPFKCNVCGASFATRSGLNKHLPVHSAVKLFECNVCGESFVQKNKFDAHLLIHTGEKPNKCSICSEEFRLKSALKKHMYFKHENVVPNKQPTLPIFISQEKDSSENVSQHVCTIQENVKIEPFEEHDTEFDTNETFGQNTTLSGNEMDTDDIEIGEEDVKPFEIVKVKMEASVTDNSLTCGKSNEEFSSRELTSHESVFKCKICNKTFTKQSSLSCHLRIHEESKSFTCPECSSKFSRRGYLKKHLLLTHKVDENEAEGLLPPPESYICETCNFKFKRQIHLKKHIESVHQGLKPFKCTLCGASFAKKSGLNKHLPVHSAVKPFECSVCGAGFVQKNKFDAHLLIHTGEKPNKCSICSEKFRLKSALKRHMYFKHENVVPNDVIPNKQPILPIFIRQEKHTVCVQVGSSESLSQHLCTFQDNFKIEPHDTEFDSNETFGQNTTLSGNEMDTDNIEIGEEDVKPFEMVEVKIEASEPDNSLIKFNENYEKQLSSHDSAFKCSTCNKTLTTKYGLIAHLKLHAGIKKFTCVICNHQFALISTYKNHLLHKHKLDENLVATLLPSTRKSKHKCESCNAVFTSNATLTNHMKQIHNILPQFKCSICDYSSMCKYSLKRHYSTKHSTEGPYKCSECNEGFELNYLLKEHIRKVHTYLYDNCIQGVLKPVEKTSVESKSSSDLCGETKKITLPKHDVKATANLTSDRPKRQQSAMKFEDRQPVYMKSMIGSNGKVTRYLSRLDKREVTEERGSPIEGLPPPLATPAPPVRDDPRHPCGAVSVTSDLLLGTATSTLGNVRREHNYFRSDSNCDDDELSSNHSSKYCSESDNTDNIESDQLEKFEEMYIKAEPIVEEENDIVAHEVNVAKV